MSRQFLLPLFRRNRKIVFDGRRVSRQIELVMSKAGDVMPDIRRKRCYGLLIEFTALKSELLEFLAYHKHIVEDHAVSYQVIEFDDFALFLSAVFGDHAFPSKEHPLCKPIIGKRHER